MTSLHIRPDDLTGPEIIALLHEHLRCMAEVSPPESRHALNLDGLRQPGITLFKGSVPHIVIFCFIFDAAHRSPHPANPSPNAPRSTSNLCLSVSICGLKERFHTMRSPPLPNPQTTHPLRNPFDTTGQTVYEQFNIDPIV